MGGGVLAAVGLGRRVVRWLWGRLGPRQQAVWAGRGARLLGGAWARALVGAALWCAARLRREAEELEAALQGAADG